MKFPEAPTHAPALSICIMLALLAGCPGPSFGDTLANTHHERTAAVHTLIAVGDIMLSGSATPLLQAKGYDYPFKDINLGKIITFSDVAFGNLEYPITMGGNRYKDKGYTFRGMPESLRAVKRAGFDLLSLANNHIMDYGEKGLKDTIRQCRINKLVYAGAGTDRTSALRLGVLKRHGVRYGLLAYSLTFPEEFWATSEKPGTAHPDWAQMGQDIRAARPNVDILIVSFHWGEELKADPKKYQVDFAHHAINSGADVVLGHHPHVPQPIEVYKGKPIFYSLGNYAFGSMSEAAVFSFAAKIIFHGNEPVRVNLYPLNVHNQDVGFQPRLAGGPSAKKIITHLMEISKSFGTVIHYQNGIGKIMIASENPAPSLTASKDENLSSVDSGPHKPKWSRENLP